MFFLRSKVYSFKCKDNNERKKKIKGISESQTKYIHFEEYEKCLDGKENQKECSDYILPPISYEMHLQEVKKSSLSILDSEPCYINGTETIPWN